MTKNIKLALFASLLFILLGCNDDLTKYDRPEWLAGKLYTQLLEQEDLSLFTTCVERSGYDTIIDISGSYTVFAPNNQAFSDFFANHPEYNSVDDIPQEAITDLVKFHIVQNPWSKTQLRTLDVYGWIDSTDLQNNKPRGFKRETILRPPNRELGVTFDRDRTYIVEEEEALLERIVLTDSRKYAPIFFSEYFDIYDLTSEDYQFYFNRSFESSELYFSGAQILSKEIFAENGFIYEIDQVVSPLKSAYELLNTEYPDKSYSNYLTLVNRFADFNFNEEAYYDQPGAEEGLAVDSIFDLNYPALTFNVINEGTRPPWGGGNNNFSIRYHHGMVAPTDVAMDKLINDYLSGPNQYGQLESAPEHIQRIVVNTHMSQFPVYPSDLSTGFYNGERDLVTVNENAIVQREFGSNSTFIGVDEPIVPRAFKSVTGPIYTQRGYSIVMNAIERTGLLAALKRADAEYTLFLESDADLRADSSLLYDPNRRVFRAFQTGIAPLGYFFRDGDLQRLILNHTGTAIPEGVARKEFIYNLAGNVLVFDNQSGEVRGTSMTTAGYKNEIPMANFPTQISINADNGITYQIDNWFSFANTSLEVANSLAAPAFHQLIEKAGLVNSFDEYRWLSQSDNYTIFAPSDSAVLAAGADTLTGNDLKDFIRMHFIQGEVIFTDGKKAPGYYVTTLVNPDKSTQYRTEFYEIYIEPGIDIISVADTSGGVYASVNESPGTNRIASRELEIEDYDNPAIRSLVNRGVVHVIDKAFSLEEMDTN